MKKVLRANLRADSKSNKRYTIYIKGTLKSQPISISTKVGEGEVEQLYLSKSNNETIK